MTIGDRVRTARKAAGLTQEQLARRTDLTLKAVGELERSETMDPHYSTLLGLANALGTTIAELVGEEPAVPLAEPPEAGPDVEAARVPHFEETVAECVRVISAAQPEERHGEATAPARNNALVIAVAEELLRRAKERV